jgi:hypothetical protein
MRGGRQVNSLRKAPRVQGICVLKAIGRVQRSAITAAYSPSLTYLLSCNTSGTTLGGVNSEAAALR